jgi:uncharacterized protein YutE (UPF0331/DUF86 family)
MSSKEQKYILSIANLVSEGLIDPSIAHKLSRLAPCYELIAMLADMVKMDVQTVNTFLNRILERES